MRSQGINEGPTLNQLLWSCVRNLKGSLRDACEDPVMGVFGSKKQFQDEFVSSLFVVDFIDFV
jgi:hypothetical protein